MHDFWNDLMCEWLYVQYIFFQEVWDKFLTPSVFRPPVENDEKAVAERAQKRTIMEFTRFDWSKIPLSHEGGSQSENNEAQLITVRFQ